MDANTLSVLQQQQQLQQLQQHQQLSSYQYSNFNPLFLSQESQTLQLFAELFQLKLNQSHLTNHSTAGSLRSEFSNPYITKLMTQLPHLIPRTTSLGTSKPSDLFNYDGIQTLTNSALPTDPTNRFGRTPDQGMNNPSTVDNLDTLTNAQSLAMMTKFAHHLIQMNSRTCGSFTSPSISPESNRSVQLGDNSSPINPINMKCASTPKPLDLRDRVQALERLNDMFYQSKQQTSDDLSSGPLFDNSQYTALQSSLEESGCIDLSYAGAQRIQSKPNELLSSFGNFPSLDGYQHKAEHQFGLSVNGSISTNVKNETIQTNDVLTSVHENVKKTSSPPSRTLPLSTIPLNFDSDEFVSSLLRMKTPCKSPGQIEPLNATKEENNQELHQTSVNPASNTIHHGRTKNRKSGFQAGVTVGYTYDAFFISDGRSRKRSSNKNPKTNHRTRHSSNILSPNPQCGLSHSSNSSLDGSILSVTTNRPVTPALSSHLSLASTLSPPQETNIQRYSCPDCGKNYATSSNLSRHKQTHRSLDSQSARKCPQCGKAYVSMPALSMHMLTHDLKHRCDMCGKAFSRPWLLQGHRRAHTGEKPYGCAHCGRAFADRSNLRAHMQTHSGMKHFECKQCHKNFALKSYLNKHLESGCLNKLNIEIGHDQEQVSLSPSLSSTHIPPHISNTLKHKSKTNPPLSWSVTDLIN